jgi:hypothetical protein
MSSWYIVIYAATGEAYSIGTDIADPMPAHFVAVPLTDADAELLNTGRAMWDAASRAIAMRGDE